MFFMMSVAKTCLHTCLHMLKSFCKYLKLQYSLRLEMGPDPGMPALEGDTC